MFDIVGEKFCLQTCTVFLPHFQVISKDTNVMLVTLAAKIIGSLAAGLRKKFAPHASGVSGKTSCTDA